MCEQWDLGAASWEYLRWVLNIQLWIIPYEYCLIILCTLQVAKWTVGKLGSDKTPQLNGTIMLIPNSEKMTGTEEAPPIQMHWKVPMASVSGPCTPSSSLTQCIPVPSPPLQCGLGVCIVDMSLSFSIIKMHILKTSLSRALSFTQASRLHRCSWRTRSINHTKECAPSRSLGNFKFVQSELRHRWVDYYVCVPAQLLLFTLPNLLQK